MCFVQTPPTQITAVHEAESFEFSVASDILLWIPFSISLDVLNVIQLISNAEYLVTFLLELSAPLLQLFFFLSHSSRSAP